MGAFERRQNALIEGEDAMATMAVQLTIGDYGKWRPVFDKHKPLRDKAGIKNVRVYRDADYPKEVIVWGETGDAAKARAALGGDEIKNAMKEAGVVGPPKIHVVA
jgi:erythromycin esterase-like protein